jgi:hypothetical protein
LKQTIYGTARDLGPYELAEGTVLGVQMLLNKSAGFDLQYNINDGTVHFSTGFAGIAQVQVFALNGRLISTVWNKRVEAGAEYDTPISTNLLEPGIYLCRLTCGSQSKTCKLLVLR